MIAVFVGATTRKAGSCTLGVPRIGRWVAHVSLDDDRPIEGRVVIRLGPQDAPVDWIGTVASSGVVRGYTQARIVGAVGLERSVPPRPYQRASVRQILAETIAEVGETLSIESTIPGTVPSWSRHREPAASVVSRLTASEGLTWRVRPTGEVWVGTESWPEADDSGVTLIDGDASLGIYTIAVDQASVLPGTTWRGNRVERVLMQLEGRGNRTKVFL